jgi:UDP-N-acetylglucosamine--dolichyl-phosphate N-acetylglucosaminephosphotransferase
LEKILLIPIGLAFFSVLFTLPFWIKRAKKMGLSGKDVHKEGEYEVAEAGGVIFLLGFVLGTLSYIALKTFYFKTTSDLIEIFALLNVVLIAALVGFTDDILGWKIGLNMNTRVLLLIFASVPLVVINAGESTMMGIEFGLFYPLLLIPIGVVGATATFNFLAGYNGLEASQGIILLSGLALVTFLTESSWLSLILLIMIAALIAFYFFNHCPAKVFPGDSLTYPIGALIAIVAILGNIEKIAIFFFIPYILEVVLKLRGGLKKQSFGVLKENGLENRYAKIYGLEHLAIRILKKTKKKVREVDVVYLINVFQIAVIAIGLLIFRYSIF